MKAEILFTSFLLLLSLCTYDEDIKSAILSDYNPLALPLDGQTQIRLSFALIGVVEVNTVESYAVLAGYVKHKWLDERLSWVPADHGGIEKVRVNTDP
jgi:hypothetical protein